MRGCAAAGAVRGKTLRARGQVVTYDVRMGRELPRFPLEPTREETAFGFELGESPSGARALVARLGAGLVAVKTRAADGSIRYAICDDRFEPLYVPAKTLEELGARYHAGPFRPND